MAAASELSRHESLDGDDEFGFGFGNDLGTYTFSTRLSSESVVDDDCFAPETPPFELVRSSPAVWRPKMSNYRHSRVLDPSYKIGEAGSAQSSSTSLVVSGSLQEESGTDMEGIPTSAEENLATPTALSAAMRNIYSSEEISVSVDAVPLAAQPNEIENGNNDIKAETDIKEETDSKKEAAGASDSHDAISSESNEQAQQDGGDAPGDTADTDHAEDPGPASTPPPPQLPADAATTADDKAADESAPAQQSQEEEQATAEAEAEAAKMETTIVQEDEAPANGEHESSHGEDADATEDDDDPGPTPSTVGPRSGSPDLSASCDDTPRPQRKAAPTISAADEYTAFPFAQATPAPPGVTSVAQAEGLGDASQDGGSAANAEKKEEKDTYKEGKDGERDEREEATGSHATNTARVSCVSFDRAVSEAETDATVRSARPSVGSLAESDGAPAAARGSIFSFSELSELSSSPPLDSLACSLSASSASSANMSMSVSLASSLGHEPSAPASPPGEAADVAEGLDPEAAAAAMAKKKVSRSLAERMALLARAKDSSSSPRDSPKDSTPRGRGQVTGSVGSIQAKLLLKQQPKSLADKLAEAEEAAGEQYGGKLVVYTSSMRAIKATSNACNQVRRLLQALRVRFEERDIFMGTQFHEEMQSRCPGLRVPQVFFNGKLLGDADQLTAMNDNGELDALFASMPRIKLNVSGDCAVCDGRGFYACTWCGGDKQSMVSRLGGGELVKLRCTCCNENGLMRCTACMKPTDA